MECISRLKSRERIETSTASTERRMLAGISRLKSRERIETSEGTGADKLQIVSPG